MKFVKKKTGLDLIHWGDTSKMHFRAGHNKVHDKFYIQLTDRGENQQNKDNFKNPSYRIYFTDEELLVNITSALITMQFERNMPMNDILDKIRELSQAPPPSSLDEENAVSE